MNLSVNAKVRYLTLDLDGMSVTEQHAAAREAFRVWSEAGRPRQGVSRPT